MDTLGSEWYQFFWEGYPTYIRDHNIAWGKTFSDREWSDMMFDFLEELAKDMNFNWRKEESTIKSLRFDMTWRSSDKPPKTIFIEHENQKVQVALKEEIPKLITYKANLHVCITYVDVDDFPGDMYAEQARALLEESGYESEFLLILGSWIMDSPTDWVCHRMYQRSQLGLEKLVLPSPIALGPTASSEKGRRGNLLEDWMINRVRVWKRIQQKGGSVTRDELHDIAKQVKMDNRGLGGFFVGHNRSLYWKGDRVVISPKALEYVKKFGSQVK